MFDKLIPWKRRAEDYQGSRLSRYQGDDPFTVLRRDFDNLLSRLWEDDWSRFGDQRGLSTSVDFDEDDKEYVMTAELPGFEPDEIDVKVSGNVLTVKAEHKEEENNGKHGRLRRYGSFYQTFTLPQGVKGHSIDAQYHSGVLEMHLPKDETTPSKRIEVKSA